MEEKSPTYCRIVTVWTDGETRLLLDRYASYLPNIGPLKQFRTKKDMWKTLATEFDGRSWKQCEDRYKTIMKRKKVAVENNNSSGAKRQKLQFEEEIEKICNLDDSIEPAIQISSQNVLRKNPSEPKEKPKKQKTVQEALLEIAARKEEAKDKRHRERMERADRIESLLEKLVNKNNQT